MAINSRQKRSAAVGAGRPWLRSVHPDSLSAEQRASIGTAYPVTSFGAAGITGEFVTTLGDMTSVTPGLVIAKGTFVVTLADSTSDTTGKVEAEITGVFIATLGDMTSLTTGTVDESDELELQVSSRIVSILTRVRDTLADPKKERWSDERLLRLLDEAQQDLAKQSKLLKATFDLSLIIDVADYKLPEDLWLITRATFDDYEIPMRSYDFMDEQARKEILADRNYDEYERRHGFGTHLGDFFGRTNWEIVKGSRIQSLIYDNRNVNQIRTYPIPNEDIAQSTYTFENAGPILFAGDELLGVTTSIDEYTEDSVFGVVTSLFEPAIETEIFDSVFGVITGASESDVVIKLWYIKIPAQLTSLSQELEMPPMFDIALKHYVVGHALRDDLDVQYREMGAESLALYERELGVADETDRSDGTRNATNHTSTYRGGFE